MALRQAPSIEPRGRSAAPDTELTRRRDAEAFARSTPARISVIALVLGLLVLAAGAVTGAEVDRRQDTLLRLLAESEPLSYSAQDLYSALSVADAAATTAFLSPGLEPEAVRQRYLDAVGTASREIVAASAGLADASLAADTASSRDLLTDISSGLALYTGLIDTARANNRSGNPVGTSYLGAASAHMQQELLPRAQQLYERQHARVQEIQQDYSTPPWLVFTAPALAVVGLIIVQVRMARRTHRKLNPGMLISTVGVSVMLLWLMGSGLGSALAAGKAHSRGALPVSDLTAARIAAQQARGVETLELIRRDSTTDYEQQFADRLATVDQAIDTMRNDRIGIDPGPVADAASAWRDAHDHIRQLLVTGRFNDAVRVAIGDPDTEAAGDPAVPVGASAQSFDRLDAAIDSAIVEARQTGRDAIGTASNALTALTGGAVGLTVLSLAGLVVGIWPRLREYR